MRQRLLLGVGAIAHRPELQHAKPPSTESHAFLSEEDRAW